MPVIPRAEMLAELMRLKYGVAVAGSHGKTTTTSMVALVLDKGGLDPTVVVGGRLGVLGSGARLGKGDFMVAEADESDRSFLKLSPTVAVVTNIDREHLDTYKDLADVQEAFLGFVNKVPFYGAAVLCLDDAPVQDLLPRVERRVVTYGLSPQAHVSARDLAVGPLGSTYTATLAGEPLGEVSLHVPGAHNAVNSLAAVAVGQDLGVPFAAVKAGLESFTGVDRRFQVRGEAGSVLVVDDYGHHPTEIRATLETLRTRAGARRTVVLFQPHRFTRTQALWDDFCRVVPPGRRGPALATSTRREKSRSRASPPRRWPARCPSAATATPPTPATSRRRPRKLAGGGPGRRRGLDPRRGQRLDRRRRAPQVAGRCVLIHSSFSVARCLGGLPHGPSSNGSACAKPGSRSARTSRSPVTPPWGWAGRRR